MRESFGAQPTHVNHGLGADLPSACASHVFLAATNDLRGFLFAKEHTYTMPWQIAPPLVIIAGAFSATGGLLYGIQYLAYGKVRTLLRRVCICAQTCDSHFYVPVSPSSFGKTSSTG